MEYLMTYGWAILIIAVVLGALFQLGVFNSSSFSPRAPPGACQVFRPSGPGTTTNINLMGVCTGQLPQYVAKFNGLSSWVNAGNTVSLNIATAITLEAWIRPDTVTPGYQAILEKGWWMPIPKHWLYLRFSTLILEISSSSDVVAQYLNLQPGNWYQVVGTWDGSNVQVYVNGQAGSGASATGNIGQVIYPYAIGSMSEGQGSNNFNGLIANVQIYNASLSANQIQALYLEGIGGAPMKLQNLAGWWPLNGNSNDYSGNNNNGVPTAVTFTSQYGK